MQLRNTTVVITTSSWHNCNKQQAFTMSAQLAKLTNPAFYRATWAATKSSAYAKFHPDVRNNGYVVVS